MPGSMMKEAYAPNPENAGGLPLDRLHDGFVFAQAGLTVTILAVGLLLFLSYQAMARTDMGFAHSEVLTMNLSVKGPISETRNETTFLCGVTAQVAVGPRSLPRRRGVAGANGRPHRIGHRIFF